MDSVTIDREGAQRLYEHIDAEPTRPVGLLRALGRAAAGDFADLRDLLGEREGAGGEFRVGDVVFVANGTGSWTVESVGASIELRQGENTWSAHPSALTLLRRRDWRVGECPPVAVGQERGRLHASSRYRFTVGPKHGDGRFAIQWRDGHQGSIRVATAEQIAQEPLCTDWLAPEAVEVRR